MQGVEYSVEKVTLRETFFIFAFNVRHVFKNVWSHPCYLRVDQLDGELRPLRHLARRHILGTQDFLSLCHDVLEKL